MQRCCDVEPIIKGSKIVLEGDDTPNLKTRVYTVVTMQCINPRCSNFKRTWEEKIEMQTGG